MAVSASHFTNENASFAPAASPVSAARRIGQVMIADLRKKFRQSLARHLTEKIYCLSSNVTQT
jgi:ribosomal protein S3AE